MKDEPLVSIVIPTFNSGGFLEECLRSVKKQTYGNIEIIIVDNYSTDRTMAIARNYKAEFLQVDAKRSEARNIGAKKAKGEFVFFVDSDMELNSSVVSECVEKVMEGCDEVIVPEISVGEGFWAKCRALEKACYIGDDLIEAARFFRRSIFESVGGYDLELEAGEDWDLHLRIRKTGYRVGRVSALIKHHEGWLSLRKIVLKKHYYGKTMKRYRIKHPEEAKQQLRLVRPAFVKNKRKLLKDPIHALGMLFMKTCEFAAGCVGFLAL